MKDFFYFILQGLVNLFLIIMLIAFLIIAITVPAYSLSTPYLNGWWSLISIPCFFGLLSCIYFIGKVNNS